MCTPFWAPEDSDESSVTRGRLCRLSTKSTKSKINGRPWRVDLVDFSSPSFWADRHVITEHRCRSLDETLPLRTSHLRRSALRAKPRRQTRQAGDTVTARVFSASARKLFDDFRRKSPRGGLSSRLRRRDAKISTNITCKGEVHVDFDCRRELRCDKCRFCQKSSFWRFSTFPSSLPTIDTSTMTRKPLSLSKSGPSVPRIWIPEIVDF